MAEQLDSLLQKIQDEHVAKAEQEAQAILSKAHETADAIIAEAQKKAEKKVTEAEKKTEQFVENGKKTLQFAARDLLMYLREEINRQFTVLFRRELPEIVTVDVIQEIMIKLATQARQQNTSSEDLRVYVSDSDYHKLIDFFLHRFHEAVKQGAELHPMKNIKAGFRICMSNRDIHYDFSDEALVEMLSELVNPAIAEILQSTEQPAAEQPADQAETKS